MNDPGYVLERLTDPILEAAIVSKFVAGDEVYRILQGVEETVFECNRALASSWY